MPSFRVTRRRASILIIAVASLLMIGGVGAAANRSGNGKIGKVTKTTVTNSGGVFSAQGAVNHFAETGTRNGAFTVDVKDKTVAEVSYYGSYFCLVDDAGNTTTKSFNGTASVEGRARAKVKTKLPAGHLGCDLALTATVLRPGQGDAQAEIILRKMILTATAS